MCGRSARSPNSPRDLKLASLLDMWDAPPPAVSRIPPNAPYSWCLNDRIGTCTIAGPCHVLQAWDWQQGKRLVIPDSAVEFVYRKTTGYDGTPATDRGGKIVNALTYFRHVGIEVAPGEHRKIAGFARVDLRDALEVRTAMNLFGPLVVGADLPQRITKQDRWSLLPIADRTHDDQPRSLGGHCYTWVDADHRTIGALPWLTRHDADYEHEQFYCDEAWALFDQELVDGRRASPAGFSVDRLRAALERIDRD